VITLEDLIRQKENLTGEVEKAAYDHHAQRRIMDLNQPKIKYIKSSTMFDGEGYPEDDPS